MTSYLKSKQAFSAERQGTVIGTGFLAWDVVMVAGDRVPMTESIGGTVGNVLSILSSLGAESIPVSRLANDMASQRIRDEFSSLGVCLDFVSIGNCVPQPVVYQINKCRHSPGHEFSFYCPSCGERAPRFQPIEKDAAQLVSGRLPHADFFFFDRVSPGSLELARACSARGGLVFFEPSDIGDEELFREALVCADIVKYSHDRMSGIHDFSVTRESSVLEIKTLGDGGLAFRRHSEFDMHPEWQLVGSFKLGEVRDTSGAGDWCSAGIIHSLMGRGVGEFGAISDLEWHSMLVRAQAFSAVNCLFTGARGAMQALTRSEILGAVDRLYEGNVGGLFSYASTATPPPTFSDYDLELCPMCMGHSFPTP